MFQQSLYHILLISYFAVRHRARHVLSVISLPHFFLLSLCLISFLFISTSVQAQERLALNPKKPLSQYIIDNWATAEGLPSKTLTTVLQTKDGYLWIGTYNGLLQFDGAKFKTYTKEQFPVFKTNSFTEITENKEGVLYVGTGASGLFKFEHGVFTKIGGAKGANRPVESIFFAENGSIWVGTRGDGVYIYNTEDAAPVKFTKQPSLNNISVSAIVKDQKDNKWLATEGNGLVKMGQEGVKTFTTEDGLCSDQVMDVFVDDEGIIWISTTKGVNYIDEQGLKTLKGTKNFPINRIIEDAYHSIWIASTKGVFRLNGQSKDLEFISDKDGLPHRNIIDINTDREGSIWMASYRAGLCRLKDARFENFSIKNGLSAKTISSVAELQSKSILVATGAGKLHLIEDNQVKDVRIKTFLSNNRIKHLNQDSKGNVLVSTYSGLLMLKPNGQEKLYDIKAGLSDNQARVSFEDSKGNIWIGTRAGGVTHLNTDTEEITVFDRSKQLSSNFIMAIEEDKEGNMLFGLNDAGVDIMKPDGTIKNYNIEHFGSNLIFNFHVDHDNNIWVATNAGISLIKPEGSVTRFTTSEGMYSEIIFDILEDQHHTLWFTSSAGVFSIPKQQFFNIESGQRKKLEYKQYGPEDGMLEKECTGATQSEIGTDGKMYFPTLGGLSIFDPTYAIAAIPEPPVYVNDLVVDGQPINLYQNQIELGSDVKRLTFGFTGLNLTSPHQLSFQYQLEGYEGDWVDAGNERQAVYTQISPGKHTFKVRVSHKNGIWNQTIARLSFTRTPHFTETFFFYVLILLGFLAIAYVIYLWRVKRISARNRELENIVAQRTEQITKQHDKLELAYNDIRTVSTIGQEVTSTLDIDQLIHIVYENVKTLMKADIFGIALLNKQKKHLEFRNLIRVNEISESHIERLSDKFYLSVQCLENKTPILINSAEKEYPELATYLQAVKRTKEEDSQSAIYVPLSIEGEAVGVLTVQSFTEDAYRQQHLTILQALASYISVALDNSRIYEEIKLKNHQITNSIRYAETIQQAVLPAIGKMNEALHEYFIIYRPKDIVSGDFYWFSHQGDRIYIAVVDCTGHGVPGAFMSMIGSSLLDEIVNVEKVEDPAVILQQLHRSIRTALKQEESGNDDGMDVALCLLEPSDDFKTKVTFSGAKRPLYYSNKGALHEVKGVNKSIGGIKTNTKKSFKNQEFILQSGDTLYLTSDGLVDQNGPDGSRFGTNKFLELLQNAIPLDLDGQQTMILRALENHQKFFDQRDDITVIGVRV